MCECDLVSVYTGCCTQSSVYCLQHSGGYLQQRQGQQIVIHNISITGIWIVDTYIKGWQAQQNTVKPEDLLRFPPVIFALVFTVAQSEAEYIDLSFCLHFQSKYIQFARSENSIQIVQNRHLISNAPLHNIRTFCQLVTVMITILFKDYLPWRYTSFGTWYTSPVM